MLKFMISKLRLISHTDHDANAKASLLASFPRALTSPLMKKVAKWIFSLAQNNIDVSDVRGNPEAEKAPNKLNAEAETKP